MVSSGMGISFRTAAAAGAAMAAAQEEGKSEQDQVAQGILVARLVDRKEHQPQLVVKTPPAPAPRLEAPDRPRRRAPCPGPRANPLASLLRWLRRG